MSAHDISQGGACIDTVQKLRVCDHNTLILPGMREIDGEIVRDGDRFGVAFTPSRLQPEELRTLVTSPEWAA